jgi:hypothetical protein
MWFSGQFHGHGNAHIKLPIVNTQSFGCDFKCFQVHKLYLSWVLSILRVISAHRQWLIPIILAAQEAEIRRIAVQSQPRKTVCKTLSWKTLFQKIGPTSGSRWRPWVQTPIPHTQKKLFHCHCGELAVHVKTTYNHQPETQHNHILSHSSWL